MTLEGNIMFEDQLREIIEAVEGWTVDSSEVIICPCGDAIELDGVCPEGHESPLMTMGMI